MSAGEFIELIENNVASFLEDKSRISEFFDKKEDILDIAFKNLNINNIDEYINSYFSKPNVEIIKNHLYSLRTYLILLFEAIEIMKNKEFDKQDIEDYIDISSKYSMQPADVSYSKAIRKIYGKLIPDFSLPKEVDQHGKIVSALEKNGLLVYIENYEKLVREGLNNLDDQRLIKKIIDTDNIEYFINSSLYESPIFTDDIISYIIKKEKYDFFWFINSERFKKLSKEELLKSLPIMLKEQHYINLDINSIKDKFKTIFASLSLSEIEKSCGTKALDDTLFYLNQFTFLDEANIFNDQNIDYIIENDLQETLKIEYSKSVKSNKDYILKLINNGYFTIIPFLNESIIDEDIIKATENALLGEKKERAIITLRRGVYATSEIQLNDKLILTLLNYSTPDIINIFLNKIPNDKNREEYDLFLVLNSNYNTDLRTPENIQRAIDAGYKCNSKTFIKSFEEAEIFMKNGQCDVVNYTRHTHLPVSFLGQAADKGVVLTPCALDSANNYFGITHYLLKHCIEQKQHENILSILKYVGSINFYVSILDMYKNIDFLEFIEKQGLLDDLIKIVVLEEKRTDIIGGSLEKSISQRYNINIINNYIKYWPRFNPVPNSIEELSIYFDESGPTKEFYKFVLTIDEYDWYNDEYYKVVFKDEKEVLSFINFGKSFSPDNVLIRKIINDDISNIKLFFDESGPTKEFCEFILEKNNYYLLSDEIFNKLYEMNMFEQLFQDKPHIIRFTNFLKKYDNNELLDKIIDDKKVEELFKDENYIENLSNYFNSLSRDEKDSIFNSLRHTYDLGRICTPEFIRILEPYIINRFFEINSRVNSYDRVYSKEEIYDSRKKIFDYLLEKVGPTVAYHMDSESIQKLLDKDTKELDLFFNLFTNSNTSLSKNDTYNNICVSASDFVFKRLYPEVTNVFTVLKRLIKNTPTDELSFLLTGQRGELSESFNDLYIWYNKINEILNYDELEKQKFLVAILEAKNENYDLLAKISRSFLITCQQNFLKSNGNSILDYFDISPTYDLNDGKKKFTEHLKTFLIKLDEDEAMLVFNNWLSILKKGINDYDNIKPGEFIESIKMTKSEFDIILNINKNDLALILDLIKNPKEPDSKTKKTIGLFRRFINQMSIYYIENDHITKAKVFREKNVKKISILPLQEYNMFAILSNLDINLFLENVASNKELMDCLRRTLKKVPLGKLPDKMGRKLDIFYNINLPGGINNIGKFISRFNQTVKNKQTYLKNQNLDYDISKIGFTFSELIELISKINSETYEIRRLLDSESYKFFISNPPNNDNSYPSNTREQSLVKVVDYLYTLSEVTIPSDDIVLESNEKKLNFIIGNRTNSSNISHGERTGACMRIGGAGEGLFLKCLTDKNWFHIRIEDPETHEYVSRVSGFRNGNTLYLNQLREVPKDSKYTNKDLQEFICLYAKSVLEKTKDSKYPIENVFINDMYAMDKFGKEIYHLGDKIKKEYALDQAINLGITNRSDIWTDVSSKAYLLATTEEGKLTSKGYAPIKNGPENAEVYSCVRDKIYGLNNIDACYPKHRVINTDQDGLLERINRVNAMKQKLLGKDLYIIDDKIDPESIINTNYFIDGYASSDWYVYIDKDKNLHFDYIKEILMENKLVPYNQSKDALEELENYKNILINSYINEDVRIKR